MDSVFEWRNYKTWVKLDCRALPNIVQWSMHTPCKMRQTIIVLHLRIWCDRCDLRALRSMEVSVVSTPMDRQVWQILKAESCSSQFVYDATVWITQFSRVDRGREVQVVKPTFLLWCGCAWNVLLGKSKQLKIESRMCIEDQHYQAMAPAFRYRGTLVQLRCWDSATSKTWRSQVVLVESSLRSVSPRRLKHKPGEDDGNWRYEYHATPCAEGRISQYTLLEGSTHFSPRIICRTFIIGWYEPTSKFIFGNLTRCQCRYRNIKVMFHCNSQGSSDCLHPWYRIERRSQPSRKSAMLKALRPCCNLPTGVRTRGSL